MRLRIVLSLVLLSLFAFSNQSKKAKNDIERMNLKGKVKSIQAIAFSVIEESGEIRKGARVISPEEVTVLFDKNGNNIEERMYNYFEGSSLLSSKTVSKFDDNGNVIETITTSGSNLEIEALFETKVIYEYDNEGNKIVMKVFYTYENNFPTKFTYKYDSKGNEIEQYAWNANDSLQWRTASKYDDRGNKIERIDSGLLDTKYIYKYDSVGNQIETSGYKFPDNRLIDKQTFKYDDKRNVIEEVYESEYPRKQKYQYDYDKQGNWIKKIVFVNDKPSEIIERQIEYYN